MDGTTGAIVRHERHLCLQTKSHRLLLSIHLSLLYFFCSLIWLNTTSEKGIQHPKREWMQQHVTQNDKVFVISLQGTPGVDKSNARRLDKFAEAWTKSCGFAFEFEHCPGVHDERRGYGPSMSFLFCLESAQFMQLNVTVIFEDDARLFEGVNEFCHGNNRRSGLWSHLPHDTLMVLLGGHSWNVTGPRIGNGLYQYQEVASSWGAYGFAVPRNSLRLLIDTLKHQIVGGYAKNGIHKHHNFLSPEQTFYDLAKSSGRRNYAVHPLVVWHEGGFSNTWKKKRSSILGYEEPTPDCPLGSTC